MTASVVSGERRVRHRRPRSRATFTSVLGELLLTAGVLVLLFVAWQMWIGDIIISAQKNDEGAAVSQEWASVPAPELPPLVDAGDGTQTYEPVIPARPADTELLGQMHVPRFGSEYNVGIYGGTTRARTLDKLQVGDAIVVETPDGWFTYRFRTLEYVKPTQTEVLLDVPQMPGVATGEKYITLTACSPLYSLAERIVAYGVFESFQPRAEGPPSALTDPPPPPAAPSI